MYVLAAIRADVVVSEARSTLVERKKDFVKECLHATTWAACGWKVGDVGERGRGKGARDKDDDGERKRRRRRGRRGQQHPLFQSNSEGAAPTPPGSPPARSACPSRSPPFRFRLPSPAPSSSPSVLRTCRSRSPTELPSHRRRRSQLAQTRVQNALLCCLNQLLILCLALPCRPLTHAREGRASLASGPHRNRLS